jgi:phosphate transport system protein
MAVAPLAELRDEVADLLAQMCTAAATSLRNATVALRDNRGRLAAQVEAADKEIDDLRTRVEQIATTAMALHSPMAGNLRSVVSALRASDDIERMGDLASHVARAVQRCEDGHRIPDEARAVFVEMGEMGADMADKAAQVARTRDVLLAIELERDDDEMDRRLRSIFEMLLDRHWEHGIGAAVDVTLLARYYERFADHAVKVAKEIVYAVTGRTIAEVQAALDAGPQL